MAAKKGGREYVTMECTECKNRNYRTNKRTKPKGVKKQVGKLELSKFCCFCKTHTLHKERKK